VKENHGIPLDACRWLAENTFWYSCDTPIAAIPDRPVASCLAKWRRITSILRSPFLNRTTGMCSSSAKPDTDRRNAVPIFSMIAGDGIGNPRCAVMNDTTCPPTCNVGT
jgi:hypothetical protein